VKNQSSYRFLMLIAGILVASGILLSQVLFHQAEVVDNDAKAASEQSTSQPGATVQDAPTLANHSVSVELGSSVDAVVEQVFEEPQVEAYFQAVADVSLDFFKTLLRTLIAANAP
jgi:hypothetical protein